jgi:hypothetical protein
MKFFRTFASLLFAAGAPLIASADTSVVNQSGTNITVLRTFPTGVNIAFLGQLSWNAVILDPFLCENESTSDSPFAEEAVTLDCTQALQKALLEQMPHLAAPIAGQFLVPASNELVHSVESTSSATIVKNFACSLQEIQTASRESALASATNVGFYFAGTQSSVPKESLNLVSRALSRSGENLAIHRFVAPAFCQEGPRSTSMRATYAFRPFIDFISPENIIYRSWDNVSYDYIISEGSVRAFDRSAQVLQ